MTLGISNLAVEAGRDEATGARLADKEQLARRLVALVLRLRFVCHATSLNCLCDSLLIYAVKPNHPNQLGQHRLIQSQVNDQYYMLDGVRGRRHSRQPIHSE